MPMCFFLAVYGKYCLFHMAFFKFWYLLCFQCNVPSHRWKIKAQMKRSQMKSHRWRDHRWRVTDEGDTDEESQMKRSQMKRSQLKRSQMKSHRWRDHRWRDTDEEITDKDWMKDSQKSWFQERSIQQTNTKSLSMAYMRYIFYSSRQ